MTAVTDEEVYEAVVDAVEAGDTLPAGGAPILAIVSRVPVCRSATDRRLRQLLEEGRIEKQVGIPRSGWPQATYVPKANKD